MGEFTTKKALQPYGGAGYGGHRGLVHDVVAVELPTTAMQTGDIVWLLYVPAGAIVVDSYVWADDLDTGTSLAYNIGDATTTNLLFAATTTGQSAGSSGLASTARYTKFAAATRLKLTVTTTAETAAAGTMLFGITYFVDPELTTSTGVAPATV
jgi:hypothetical protein